MLPPFSGPGSPGSCIVCVRKNLSIRSIPVHDNLNFYAHVCLLTCSPMYLGSEVKFDLLSNIISGGGIVQPV